MKPILAFEYILDGRNHMYHTDGEKLVGPSLTVTSFTNKNEILVSYLVNTDPDNDAKIWYQRIGCIEPKEEKYNNIEMLKDAICDIELDFPEIYKHFTKAKPFKEVIDTKPYEMKVIIYPTLEQIKEQISLLS